MPIVKISLSCFQRFTCQLVEQCYIVPLSANMSETPVPL